MFNKPTHAVCMFLSGVIFSANIAKLIGISDSYEASWFKVIMSLVFAVIFGYFICTDK